jgi:hypothetical protein
MQHRVVWHITNISKERTAHLQGRKVTRACSQQETDGRQVTCLSNFSTLNAKPVLYSKISLNFYQTTRRILTRNWPNQGNWKWEFLLICFIPGVTKLSRISVNIVIGCEVDEQGSILDRVSYLIFATIPLPIFWVLVTQFKAAEAWSRQWTVSSAGVNSMFWMYRGTILLFAVNFVLLLRLHDAWQPESTEAVVQLRAQRASRDVRQPTFVVGVWCPSLGKLWKL